MRTVKRTLVILVCCSTFTRAAQAQWRDPTLIASQVGFNIAASWIGKMIFGHQSPGTALKQAFKEGTVSGLVAHTGYAIAGTNPDLALVGKALVQKSSLTTRRSMRGLPVFDRSLYSHWELTHSFVHFKWDGAPHFQVDAINAAFTVHYLLAGDQYDLDAKRTLMSGSFVFVNHEPPRGIRGFYMPGNIWIGADRDDYQAVLAHELIHSFQVERGSALSELQFKNIRINWLAFASGVPAVVSGWPAHDTRPHEREADRYVGIREK
jgi:hypothetical protein